MSRACPKGIVVRGGQDEGARELCQGRYVQEGRHHGKPTFRKVNSDVGWIYFWEDKDDFESIGWWMSEDIGSDQVWAFNPSKSASVPPICGWKAPFDGPVDASFVLSYEDQPSTASSSGSCVGCVPKPAETTSTADVCSEAMHVNEDFCQVCQKAGKLLLCEHCPRAFHVHCIERLMELDEEDLVAQHKWKCPICLHGEGILQGSTGPKYSEAEMEQFMLKALAAAKRHRSLSHRRRDLFLCQNYELVVPFISGPARARILKASESSGKLPLLEIGSKIKTMSTSGSNKGERYTAYILNQTASTRYLVVDAETGVEAEVERHMMGAIEADGDESNVDFYANARTSVLSERAKLKDYQIRGVNWLVRAVLNSGGGILADDMGLGKTVQTLACLSWLRSTANYTEPFCVVCPVSCVGNWIRECKRFVPHLSVAKLCGGAAEEKQSLENDEIWYGMKDIIVTTYEAIKACEDFFQRHTWGVLVLDEAHRIKSQFTQSRQVLDTIPCASRVLLTGTPLQNHLNELYELLRFLWPDVLASESEVFQGAVQLSETGIDWNVSNDSLPGRSPDAVVNSGKVEQVRALLSILMLRRKKVDVISLPPKIARDVWLPLTPTQVSWYKAMLNCRFEAKQQREMGIRDMFQLITRLRLTCAHPRCILSSEANEKKLKLYNSVDMDALQAMAEAGMTEQMIKESAKLSFLDKLLSHLHAQNMGMNSEWRTQFEDRQARVIGKQYKKRSASQWLKSSSEGILFLDEMRPWRPSRNVGARLRSAPAAAEEGFSAAIGADSHCPSSSSSAGPNAQKSTDSGSNPLAHTNGSASSSNVQAGDSDGEEDTPRPHKVLIFSQYHMCLDLLEKFSAFRGWRALRLDGSTNRIVRELDMRDFNSDDETYFVYLIGTRAGGLGINLHTANHVVLFDHDWNPHVDSQAIDRAHRIGQHRSVNIYRLIQEWSVEEKLVHRQEIKLKMEKCVISAKADEEDPGFDVKERLSGNDVLELLRHGEATLRKFSGEALEQKSLQELLDRARRPLLETDGEDNGHSEGHLGDEFVEDDETMGASKQDDVAPVEEVLVEPHAEALPKANGNHKEIIQKTLDEPNVMRSRSGRIIRPVVQFSQLYEPIEPKKRKRLDIKHDKLCFLCGERHKECASAREEEEEPEFECAVCPKVYHRSCLGAGVESQKRRWTCGWHHCNRCGRGPSACGGMLMHCQSCPTALCYDCFPPNFRRVTPDPKFWTDLQKKNWNMTPQKMMLFRCNSCLALAEQRKRQLMRQEDLEAQADAKKKQALEEKRNWAAKRRTRENEEARRRLRQVMGEHERAALQDALQDARDKVKNAFEALGPQDMKGSIKSKYLQKIGCLSCGFPGHKHHQCPFPREKNVSFSTASTASTSKGVVINLDSTVHVEDTGSDGAQKKKTGRMYVCSICNSYSHGRLQCPSMKREQREEYESRIEQLNDVAANISQVEMLKVLGRSMDLTQGLPQNVEIRLQEKVHEILRQLGLEHLILEPLLSEPEPKILVPRQAPKAKAKRAPMMKIPFKVKTLAKAKAKATPDGKGIGKHKGKQRKVEDKAQGKVQNLSEVQVRWQVADGVAWGWELFGGFHPNGLKFLRYRRPGETQFIEQKEALVDLDPDVYEAIKGERANVLKELDNLVQKVPQQAKSRSRTEPTPAEKHPSTRRLSEEGSNDPNAILPGYIHVYKFPSGPAMNWQMRIRVGGNGNLVYAYQRPNAQKWEYTIEQFKDDPAWPEIQSVREIQSKHIRSKLVVTSRGAALAAAIKRKVAHNDRQVGVLPDAKDTKRPRVGRAQVCGACGARNKHDSSFCSSCGKSLSKALNGHSESQHVPKNGHGHAGHPSSNGMSKNGNSSKGRSLGEQVHIESPRLDEGQPTTPQSSPGTPPLIN